MPEYFNTTNGPVVYNSDGQIAGGAEWFTSKSNPIIEKALDEGVFIPKETKSSSGKKASESNSKESSFQA